MSQSETVRDFDELERAHPEGLSVQQVVEACAAQGERLTEATFRKYVQLGLLPRSVRVGRKGKHRGSQGLYPASVVRQVQRIRELMAQGFTIEEIQSRFVFMRGEIGALERELGRVMSQLEGAHDPSESLVKRELEEVRRMAASLVDKLRDLERRLTLSVRMERAAV